MPSRKPALAAVAILNADRRAPVSDIGYHDEFGFYSPMPINRAARREPDEGFPTGPEIGSRLPPVVLPDQAGEMVDVAASTGPSGAIVVFHRSAYW